MKIIKQFIIKETNDNGKMWFALMDTGWIFSTLRFDDQVPDVVHYTGIYSYSSTICQVSELSRALEEFSSFIPFL